MFSLQEINQNLKLIFIKVMTLKYFLKFFLFFYLGPNDIQVRLICIPSFAQSNSCIALNLHTLECCEISFQNEIPEIIQ